MRIFSIASREAALRTCRIAAWICLFFGIANGLVIVARFSPTANFANVRNVGLTVVAVAIPINNIVAARQLYKGKGIGSGIAASTILVASVTENAFSQNFGVVIVEAIMGLCMVNGIRAAVALSRNVQFQIEHTDVFG